MKSGLAPVNLPASGHVRKSLKYTRLCISHVQFTLCVYLMDALYINFDIDIRAVNMEESFRTSLLQMEILSQKDKLESVFRMIDILEYKHGDLLSKRCHDCVGC